MNERALRGNCTRKILYLLDHLVPKSCSAIWSPLPVKGDGASLLDLMTFHLGGSAT